MVRRSVARYWEAKTGPSFHGHLARPYTRHKWIAVVSLPAVAIASARLLVSASIPSHILSIQDTNNLPTSRRGGGKSIEHLFKKPSEIVLLALFETLPESGLVIGRVGSCLTSWYSNDMNLKKGSRNKRQEQI